MLVRLRVETRRHMMLPMEFPLSDSLLASILQRDRRLFVSDEQAHGMELSSLIKKARLLVAGAAGSIGAEFVKQVAGYHPAGLCLIDLSENNLVELVRDLRASQIPLPEDFQTLGLSVGGAGFRRFLAGSKSFDYPINLSAVKHVRSERDPFSLMRMIETNVVALERTLHELEPSTRIFSVSSDKAVNPHSLMGASKAMMEKVLRMHSGTFCATSARFANVAFSDGSLLHGILRRLEKRQPISVPGDVRRYFISHQEAGRLCLMACFLGDNRDIFVPCLDPAKHLVSFLEVARALLEEYRLTPILTDSESEARKLAAHLPAKPREWPCFVTASDTTGEKPYEEFFRSSETVDRDRFFDVDVVTQAALCGSEREALGAGLERLAAVRAGSHWEKSALVDAIKLAVPELSHEEKARSLDDKM